MGPPPLHGLSLLLREAGGQGGVRVGLQERPRLRPVRQSLHFGLPQHGPLPSLLLLLRQHLPLHLAVEAAVLAAPGPPHLPLPLLQEVAPAALLRSCRPPSPSSAGLAAPPYQIVEADSEERGLAQAPHLTLLVQGVAALLPALQLCPLGQHLSTLPHQAGCTTSVHPCWPPPPRS